MIIKAPKNFLIFIFLLSFIPTYNAQNTLKTVVDSLLYSKNGIKNKYPYAGLSIGIVQNGKTYFQQFGNKTIDGKDPIDKNTIFEVGSATKTFTGLLLAQKIADGTIKKSEYIDQLLPQNILNKNIQEKVKLSDLASHQSGLPNLSNDKYFNDLLKKDPNNPFRFVDHQYLYNALKETDSLSGHRKYQYNNYAFSLLGDLLAKKSKTNYNSLLEKQLLKPLKLTNTSLNQALTKNVAGLYDEDGKPQQNIILNAVNPAGGLRSNAVDLIKYLQIQLGNSNPELQKAVNISQETYFQDAKHHVALGWDIKEGYFQKDGDTFGNSCLLLFDKERQIGIVALSNRQDADIVNFAVDFIYKKLISK
jgi:CubicO group peptidase (beta-lactamase class C family)